MTNKTPELRTIAASLRATPNCKFELTGTVLSYNKLSNDLGGFLERVMPGSFAAHLKTNPDVKCLRNHDSNFLLGRTGNGTLTLEDTPTRLNFRCKLDEAQQMHKDLYASCLRNDTHECSFAFSIDGPDGEEWDTANDANGKSFVRRTIKRAKIWDCSVVTSPAYENGATNVSARSPLSAPSVRELLRAELARKGEEIRVAELREAEAAAEREARALKAIVGEPMTANEVQQWRNRFSAAPGADTRSIEGCPGSGICTDAKDHERAAAYHTNRAHNAKDLPHAEAHYRAEMFHSLAAQDPSAENCTKAQGHCKRASDIDEKNEEI